MGGPGSSRWREHQRRYLVDEAEVLDIRELSRHGALEPGRAGRLEWSNGDAMTFEVRSVESVEMLIVEPVAGTTRRRAQGLWIERTERGDMMLCPNGCQRRVKLLYRPPGATQYACRRCSRLAYPSQNGTLWRAMWKLRHGVTYLTTSESMALLEQEWRERPVSLTTTA